MRQLTERRTRVLPLRSIESYLLSDEILREFCNAHGHAELASELLNAKQAAISSSVGRGNPNDDLKSAAGEIYNSVKRLFPGEKLGSNALVFMRMFCAPLIKPTTATYQQLRDAVFGG